MKKLLLYLAATCALLGGSTINSRAQGSSEYGSGLKFNLNQDGTKFMRVIMWNQLWIRSTQMNPGTAVNGQAATSATDIGARRMRVLAYAQITPRYLILMHFGINNQTFLNGGAAGTTGTGGYGAGKKPGLFFHDVWNEYAVVPTKNISTGKANKATLSIGAGLHYWHGISRMTSASTLNFLAVDAPIFNWPLIENSDQFARLFGVYAKGKIGKFEYRMNWNKPFATNLAPTEGVAVDNNGTSRMSYGGYFEYQFLDQEANVLPFKVGTYVGTKRVFNIGAGFYHQPEGTQSLKSGVATKHDISLFAVDMFADLPIGDKKKNMAVTAYSTFYSNNFGPNYLRNVSIMNIGTLDAKSTDTKALAGPGNLQPMIGTGSIWYTQAGLLLPKGEGGKARVQPFAAYTYKNFEALGKASSNFDVGCNFYLDGHHAKITPQYSTRPIYTDKNTISGNKGTFVLQAQVYL